MYLNAVACQKYERKDLQESIERMFKPMAEKFVCGWIKKMGIKEFNDMLEDIPDQINFDLPDKLKEFSETVRFVCPCRCKVMP